VAEEPATTELGDTVKELITGAAIGAGGGGGVAVPPANAATSCALKARLYTRTSSILLLNLDQLPSPPRAPIAKPSLLLVIVPDAGWLAASTPLMYARMVVPSYVTKKCTQVLT
jgi:hypothetical protein